MTCLILIFSASCSSQVEDTKLVLPTLYSSEEEMIEALLNNPSEIAINNVAEEIVLYRPNFVPEDYSAVYYNATPGRMICHYKPTDRQNDQVDKSSFIFIWYGFQTGYSESELEEAFELAKKDEVTPFNDTGYYVDVSFERMQTLTDAGYSEESLQAIAQNMNYRIIWIQDNYIFDSNLLFAMIFHFLWPTWRQTIPIMLGEEEKSEERC